VHVVPLKRAAAEFAVAGAQRAAREVMNPAGPRLRAVPKSGTVQLS
jgi:hypothetical protein